MLKGDIVFKHKLTGLLFSCCGVSSGIGRDRGFGAVRENSCGLVVLIGAFLTWLPPREALTASCSTRSSISGRHLKDNTHTVVSPCFWNTFLVFLVIFLTSAEGQSSVSPHRQHHKSCSTRLVSMWWGLWRRTSGTTAKHRTAQLLYHLITCYFQAIFWLECLTFCIILLSSALTMVRKTWSPSSSRANVAR